jgi:hypothetical protein
LRKALGDGQDGARYVINVPGRGYCFVTAIERPPGDEPASVAPVGAVGGIPPRFTRMVGVTPWLMPLARNLPGNVW